MRLYILQFPDCRLGVSVHLGGPAAGYLDTGSVGFPVFRQMLRRFLSSKLLLRASQAAFLI
jgi:hypothetical protein